MDLLKLLIEVGGKAVPLGQIAFPAIEALLELVHKLPTDPTTGAPLSKEQLLNSLRSKIEDAGGTWGDIADRAREELKNGDNS